MKSWIVALVVALIPVGAVAVGAFEDPSDTETIMKALFKKGAGKFNTALKTQVAASPTNWDDLQKVTEEINKYGQDLAKNDPEKGTKESWKKLAEEFGTNTKALDDAADSKDLAKVKDAQKTIGNSCMACHKVHRGQ